MLLDVYRNLKSRLGFKDSERSIIVAKINDAFLEIYDSADLPESLDEIIADINVQAQTITLPWFCDNVRKLRWYDQRLPITIDNQENRYHADWGNELWIKKWRKVAREALQTSISNFSILELSIPQPEAEAFTVSITGETTNSSYTNEIVSFTNLETIKVTVGNFKKVKSIAKSRQLSQNLTVKDADGNILAEIPNHLFTFKYLTIQILDQQSSALQQNYSSVEVFYKKAFHPVKDDYDEFLWGNKYDLAIVWKFLEQNKNSFIEALAAQEKCKQVLDQIIANEAVGIHSKIDFKENAYFNLPYNYSRMR